MYFGASIFVPVAALIASAAPAATPAAALADLISAEKALSRQAASLSPADGIAGMIADDGILMTRAGPVKGPKAAAASLAANPANAGKHASWHSIRGGVSADGQQGFTLGYLDIEGGDPKTAHRRYLAYWVRGADGWRVATLKQVGRAEGEAEASAQPPAVPARLAAPTPAQTATHRASLMAAEKAFSDRAQLVGLYQAFQENGRQDAIHLFGPKGFAIGLKAIGENQADQKTVPAEVNWSADDAVVASSGDLGVTIGVIRTNSAPPEGQPSSFPFFTVWMRDDPSQPWRYIAE